MIRHIRIFLLLGCIFCFGCSAKPINSHISAMAEQGHKPNGQSVSIGSLPSIDGSKPLPAFMLDALKTALVQDGYTLQEQSDKPAMVHVRVYWQNTGPYITVKENPLWDFGRGSRGPWQRERFITEEKYLRTLIIEAWSNDLAKGQEAINGLAPFLQIPLSFNEALSYLPAKPARLLWRVQARSVGNLSNIQKVLPELLNAALPWIARSVDAQVMFQNDVAAIKALE